MVFLIGVFANFSSLAVNRWKKKKKTIDMQKMSEYFIGYSVGRAYKKWECNTGKSTSVHSLLVRKLYHWTADSS